MLKSKIYSRISIVMNFWRTSEGIFTVLLSGLLIAQDYAHYVSY